MSRCAPRDGVRTFPIPGQRTAEVELPEIAKAWQPYMLTHIKRYTQPSLQIMSSDIRHESNCRYVLKARRLAIEELESVGWDGKDLHDIVRGSRDKEGAKRLISVCVLPILFPCTALIRLSARRSTSIALNAMRSQDGCVVFCHQYLRGCLS